MLLDKDLRVSMGKLTKQGSQTPLIEFLVSPEGKHSMNDAFGPFQRVSEIFTDFSKFFRQN